MILAFSCPIAEKHIADRISNVVKSFLIYKLFCEYDLFAKLQLVT